MPKSRHRKNHKQKIALELGTGVQRLGKREDIDLMIRTVTKLSEAGII